MHDPSRALVPGDDLALALRSISDTIALSSRDWGANHRDAWLWGIVHGWDDAALRDLAEKYGWTPDTIARLRRLHAAYTNARDGRRASPADATL